MSVRLQHIMIVLDFEMLINKICPDLAAGNVPSIHCRSTSRGKTNLRSVLTGCERRSLVGVGLWLAPV